MQFNAESMKGGQMIKVTGFGWSLGTPSAVLPLTGKIQTVFQLKVSAQTEVSPAVLDRQDFRPQLPNS